MTLNEGSEIDEIGLETGQPEPLGKVGISPDTSPRTERSYEQSKRIRDLRLWGTRALLLTGLVGITGGVMFAVKELSRLSAKLPDSTFAAPVTETEASEMADILSPVASPTATERVVPTAESMYDMINLLEPNNGQCLGFRNFLEMHQDRTGMMYIIATTKVEDHPEYGGKILVKDTNALTTDKERCMVGLDLGDGRYLYNFPLNQDRVTEILPNNLGGNSYTGFITRDSKQRKVNMFQFIGSGGLAQYGDNDTDNQGQFVAIQSFYDRIYPTATPTPVTDETGLSPGLNNQNSLATLLAKNRKATQKRMATGIF